MHRFKNCSHVVFMLTAFFVVLGLVGCASTKTEPRFYTMHKVEPKNVSPPTEAYSSIAIKEFTFSESKWKWLSGPFHQGLVESLKTNNAFENVVYPAPETTSESSIILTGNILKVDRGNKALKFWVGMGAGSSKIIGTFKILNNEGIILAEFDAKETYSWHADMVDIDELATAFGQTIAIGTSNWSQGKSLKEDLETSNIKNSN